MTPDQTPPPIPSFDSPALTKLTSPCGHWTAWVEIDQRLKVYDVKKNAKGMGAWIAAEPGSKYRVFVSCRPFKGSSYPDTSASIIVDGTEVIDGVTTFNNIRMGVPETRPILLSFHGRDLPGRIEKFEFSLLERQPGGTRLDPEVAEKIGTIEVSVVRGRTGSKTEEETNRQRHKVLDSVNEQEGKVKKRFVDTVTRYGEPLFGRNPCSNWKDYPHHDPTKPLFTFKFHYGQKDVLMAMGKIPNPKTRTQVKKRATIELIDEDSDASVNLPTIKKKKKGKQPLRQRKQEAASKRRLKVRSLRQQAQKLLKEAAGLSADEDEDMSEGTL